MIMPRLKASIRIANVAPLGMKFYDSVGRRQETALVVTVSPTTKPAQHTKAFVNNNGVFVLNKIYGLHDLLENAAEKTYWDDVAGEERPYWVEVSDPRERFIPFAFEVLLPHHSYYVPHCMTFPNQPAYPQDTILLYPGQAYRPPTHMARIRAQLFDPERNIPAAFAMVDVLYEGTLLTRGIADSQGNLLLCFDYPLPNDASLENGNNLDEGGENAGTAPSPFQWTLTLQAFYTRYLSSDAIPDYADICRTFSQNNARLWANWTGSESAPEDQLTEVDLTFREVQQLHSTTNIETLPKSRLFITPIS